MAGRRRRVIRTTAEEYRMAQISAYHTVEQIGRQHGRGATVDDVVQHQGLCEIRAKKALEDLVRAGRLRKAGPNTYRRPVCG